MKNNFPGNLKRIRKEKGMSLQKIEDMTGISLHLVWNYETGKTDPGLKNVLRIAETLGVSVGELVEGGGTP